MQAARRLYLYAMSGLTLAVIATGLVILVEVVLIQTGLLDRGPYDYAPAPRERISQAVAMLGVGLPVWAIHWLLIQRGLGAGRPDRLAEHGSAIRAGYLTLVLAVSLLFWVSSASTVLVSLILSASGGGPEFYDADSAAGGSTAVVAFVVWLYHGVVRRGDLAAGPVEGAAAWLPRLYLYGVALGALIVSIFGLQAWTTNMLAAPEFDEGYARLSAIQAAVAFGAWGVVWAAHWWYARRLAIADGWRGVQEQVSRMRLAAFIATIVVAVGFSISSISELLQGFLAPAIGEVPYAGNETTRSLVRSLAAVIPWLLAWWSHVRWLRREPAAQDPLRALHQVRLATHAPAAMALALGGAGLGWLLGIGIDIVFGGNRRSDTYGIPWTFELARWLPMAVAGVAVWAWHWSGVLERRRRDPEGEANSTIRRGFLYLTLAGGVVAALASATLILYRLVGTILGAGLGGNAVSELSTPIGAAVIATIVLAYHGGLLRADLRRRPDAGPEPVPVGAPGAAGAAVPPLPAAAVTRRSLELVGPAGADLDAAQAAARAALPAGFDLVVRES
ncbi:MAG: DUF5671 domain-containing protein [Chloroflexota bacterium]